MKSHYTIVAMDCDHGEILSDGRGPTVVVVEEETAARAFTRFARESEKYMKGELWVVSVFQGAHDDVYPSTDRLIAAEAPIYACHGCERKLTDQEASALRFRCLKCRNK